MQTHARVVPCRAPEKEIWLRDRATHNGCRRLAAVAVDEVVLDLDCLSMISQSRSRRTQVVLGGIIRVDISPMAGAQEARASLRLSPARQQHTPEPTPVEP